MLAVFVVSWVGLFVYVAGRVHCAVCHRPYALFVASGRLKRDVPICWRCRRERLRFERRRLHQRGLKP